MHYEVWTKRFRWHNKTIPSPIYWNGFRKQINFFRFFTSWNINICGCVHFHFNIFMSWPVIHFYSHQINCANDVRSLSLALDYDVLLSFVYMQWIVQRLSVITITMVVVFFLFSSIWYPCLIVNIWIYVQALQCSWLIWIYIFMRKFLRNGILSLWNWIRITTDIYDELFICDTGDNWQINYLNGNYLQVFHLISNFLSYFVYYCFSKFHNKPKEKTSFLCV